MPTLNDRQVGYEPTAIAPPSAARYEPGSVLCGKYRLEALLGEGGMGAVWRASNLLLDLPVAIKLIRADLDAGSFRERLQLEARSAAQLGHPAIVRVYDVGESEVGDPFIVMEHLRGETLAQLLSQGRLPATRAVQLLLPIIDALAAAHSRGIVHRDLKPDNLMIALEEQHVRPKILDFGVAKETRARDPQRRVTQSGSLIGSPEYMSPEQARGRDDLDAGSDIWSMCVVLYEAVTGRPPFAGSNCVALLRSIVEDEPKPLARYAAGDAGLWQILERGLQKERSARYADISELGVALAGWLVRQGVTEDACGSSLDSNWLKPSKEPLRFDQTLPSVTHTPHSPTRDTQDSQEAKPFSTGSAHRSFSATIPPLVGWQTRRTLGFVFAACLGLGVLLLALGFSRRASVQSNRGLVPATHAAAVAPSPDPITAVALDPPEPPPAATVVKARVSAPPRQAETKPAPNPSRDRQPSASTLRASASATPAPPAVPKPNPSLDLLTPY